MQSTILPIEDCWKTHKHYLDSSDSFKHARFLCLPQWVAAVPRQRNSVLMESESIKQKKSTRPALRNHNHGSPKRNSVQVQMKQWNWFSDMSVLCTNEAEKLSYVAIKILLIKRESANIHLVFITHPSYCHGFWPTCKYFFSEKIQTEAARQKNSKTSADLWELLCRNEHHNAVAAAQH